MHTVWYRLSVVLGLTISNVLITVTGFGSGTAKAAAQAKEQAYEAQFECTIPAGGRSCSVTLEQAIPAGMRLKITAIKANIVVPSATKSNFEFTLVFGDPSAEGGVRSLRMTPTFVGPTEGRFYNNWAVDEKVEAVASRTEKYPTPSVQLSNPAGDPLYLQYGSIRDGVLAGTLVASQ